MLPPGVSACSVCLMIRGIRRLCNVVLSFCSASRRITVPGFRSLGTNYIYGTWSVLEALRLAKLETDHISIRRAVLWLKSVQRRMVAGETNDSYFDLQQAGRFEASTSFQTAWAILGLMAAGEVHSQSVRDGVDYLLRTQSAQWSLGRALVYRARISKGFI